MKLYDRKSKRLPVLLLVLVVLLAVCAYMFWPDTSAMPPASPISDSSTESPTDAPQERASAPESGPNRILAEAESLGLRGTEVRFIAPAGAHIVSDEQYRIGVIPAGLQVEMGPGYSFSITATQGAFTSKYPHLQRYAVLDEVLDGTAEGFSELRLADNFIRSKDDERKSEYIEKIGNEMIYGGKAVRVYYRVLVKNSDGFDTGQVVWIHAADDMNYYIDLGLAWGATVPDPSTEAMLQSVTHRFVWQPLP